MADEEPVVSEPAIETTTPEPAPVPEQPSLESLYDSEPPKEEEVPAIEKPDSDDNAADGDDEGKEPDSGGAVTAPTIDAELLAQAEAWDIPRDWAERAGEAALSKELNRLWARNAVQTAQKQDQSQRHENDTVSKEREQEIAELDKILADPDYGPEMKVFVKSHKELLEREKERDRELFALRQTHAQRENAERQAELQAKTDEFDRLIEAIDAKELFGTGTYSNANATPEQMTNRHIVARQVDALERSYLDFGKKPPELPELFRRVVQAQFPDAVETKVQKTLAEKVSSRAKQTIARPSPRKGATRTPEEQAIAAVRDKMVEQGRAVDDESVDFQEF